MSVSASGLPPIPLYLADIKNETTLANKFAGYDPTTKADLDQFVAAAPKLTTYSDLAKNYQALSTVLGAYDLSGDIGYPALIKQLATQDPTSASSTAQRIGDPNEIRFAKAMDQYQSDPFANVSTLGSVVSAYKLNSFEQNQGQQIPGMQQALEFTREASQITSIPQLMANTSLLKVAVAQTGLDWSTYGNMSYNQQVSVLTSKIKLANFQNSTKVQQMAESFLVQAGQDPVASGAQDAATYSVNDLLGGSQDQGILSLFGGSSSSGSNPLLSLFA